MKLIAVINKSLIVYFMTFTLVLVTSQTLFGKNYYFSTSIGDDARTSAQAQNPVTPWRTVSKLNSFFTGLAPGDSVLFKRGESFYGTIKVAKSGTSALPIVIGAYGTGVKPVITGFTTLTAWTSLGNGIYQSEATNCKPTLNMVTVNGKNTPIGRYPNTGFLTFESHSGLTSITDNQLTGTPNWTGAEVVIRKNRFTLSRERITNHSSGTLTYSSSNEYVPIDNFGYFIQNDAKTLDLFGEWYLNPSSKRLQLFFGNANPALHTVKVSTRDTLVICNEESYLTFTNLDFEGANSTAFYIRKGQNVSVLYCGINFSGNNAMWATTNTNFKMEHCSINHSNHSALKLMCPNASIRYNIIKNTGMIRGMAYMGNGYVAIELFGGPAIVQYNEVDSVGGIGIFTRGDNTTIKNNLVNHFAFFLDDKGGIYSVGNFKGRKIIGNIILNGVGDISGTTQTAIGLKGIMLEVGTADVELIDNTIANCNISGIHLNNCRDIIVRNNLLFNNKIQFFSQNSTDNPAPNNQNISLYKNIFFSKTKTQTAMFLSSVSSDIRSFGQADSNYYCRPLDEKIVINAQSKDYSLASWQAFYGKDSHSKKSPQTITNENDILFEYNASQANKVIPLNSVYLGVDGKVFTNSYTLLPYQSVVLIKSANQTINTNLPPFIQNQNFQVNKNTSNGTTVGTVVASDPNASQLLSYSIVSGNTSNAFAINASSGLLTVANYSAIAAQTTTSYSLVVRVQDNGLGLLSSQATVTIDLIVDKNPTGCNATGNITYQVWNNIGGSTSISSLTSNSNYPNNPTSSTLITSMEGTTNQGDEYGARIAGYICAPATGSYTFWIASDNEGELWLSTNDQPANKQKIAYLTGATLPRAWSSYATQKSTTINLVQGQSYYIEAFMKEAYGGDCLAVGWLKPGQTGSVPSEVIPGSVLSPIGSTQTVPDNSPGCSAVGSINYQVWNNIGSSTSVSSLTGNINYPDNPTSSTLITSMEGNPNQANEYGARIAGYICAPATGNYTFWIASDNGGELWLSTNDQPANKQRIAYVTGATLPREWSRYATQKSATIYLVKGHSYYVEALMKEAWGGDCLAVGWLKPGQTGSVPTEVIPGSVLSPIAGLKTKEVSINNIEQTEPEIELTVYPNPLGNSELSINIDNLSSEATLKIFTITGVECITEVIKNSEVIHINRSIFKSGMYIVKVFNENFVKSTKLIVN